VDGMGGTSGPMGWHSSGAWDGEVASSPARWTRPCSSRAVSSPSPREGGELDPGAVAIQGYVEGVMKGVLSLTASLPQPAEILLAGRRARDPSA
jgi:predicted butyrate kinase (DUF1464 family)